MPDIRAFIFDLDGVITDTAEFHYLAWQRLADEEGLPFTREDNEKLRGISRRDSLLVLLKGRAVPEPTMEAWMTRKNDYYRAFLTRISPQNLLPGVKNFLDETHARGIKIGLGSASKNARDVLTGLGIASMFDAIGDGHSVSRAKPAPDLFVWVAGRLDVPPQHAVVFEDAEAGIEAAQAAHMYTVGIGPESRVGMADAYYTDLAGTHVEDILRKLPERGE